MSPELGLFALTLAFFFSIAQAFSGLWGARIRNPLLIRLASPFAIGQAMALLYALSCLIYAAVTDDFSVLNIATNSAHDKPLFYKITGVWGNHEGSILLWCLILALCGSCIPLFGKNLPQILKARVIAILGLVSSGFLLFSITTSNPFSRLWPAPMNGQGMNPLLQDPGLAIHPPILYAGYVGFSIPFAFAVAALIEGKVDAAWGKWVRPWTVGAWLFMTGGITLGSWWSYYILGWGGYWFWDPVENASLLPWLTGTALLHSSIVVERREALKTWTILLAIITFSFSLSGTFLVRSGILNSVHSFANDPARGIFILILLGLNCGVALILFAWRAASLSAAGIFAPFSREGSLVINNVLLCSIAAIVLTGTLYPPFMALLFEQNISVGKPFFDSTTLPFVIPLFIVMGIAPFLSWKTARFYTIIPKLVFCAFIVFAATLIIFFKSRMVLYSILCGCSLWAFFSSLSYFLAKLRPMDSSWSQIKQRFMHMPRSSLAVCLAHAGVSITALGIAGMVMADHKIVDVPLGTSIPLHGYNWVLSDIETKKGENYEEISATIIVTAGPKIITVLHPSKKIFSLQHQTTTDVAIHTNFYTDFYAVLGDIHTVNNKTFYVLRLHYNLLAPWIWIGGAIMVLGGIISLSDRRLRVGAPHRKKTNL